MKPNRITTRRSARPADADDPRVQVIADAIDARLASILSTVEALTDAIRILDALDDHRAHQIDTLTARLDALTAP
jgi:hypothetical protein